MLFSYTYSRHCDTDLPGFTYHVSQHTLQHHCRSTLCPPMVKLCLLLLPLGFPMTGTLSSLFVSLIPFRPERWDVTDLVLMLFLTPSPIQMVRAATHHR